MSHLTLKAVSIRSQNWLIISESYDESTWSPYTFTWLGIGNSGRDKGYELGLGIRVSFHINDSLFMNQLADRILYALDIYGSSILSQLEDRILSAFYIYD